MLTSYKLKELTIDGGGHYGIAAPSVTKSDLYYTYLRITDIKDDGSIDYTSLRSVKDLRANNFLLKRNDIVFARTGASTGRNFFHDGTDENFVYAGFLIKFSLDDEKVNPKYIKFYCQSPTYKNWIEAHNTGSTRGNINAQTFGEMEILLPPRIIQDKIVALLSPIEEKIKFNNKINDNLTV